MSYSEAETKLFTKLGFSYLMEHCEPLVLYRIAVNEAFLNKIEGPEIEALRRGAKSFTRFETTRLTPEFDALISF